MPRHNSTLIRVYDFHNKLLFTKAENSPVGKPVGVLLHTDNEEWSFFSDRHCGYPLWQLQEICNKMKILNANSPTELPSESITFRESADL